MKILTYNEHDLIKLLNLPCQSFTEFVGKYACKAVVIGYETVGQVIYGYNNPHYLPDTGYLIDYGAGKTVIISSFSTGEQLFKIFTFPDRQQAISFLNDLQYTLFVPINDILTFITENIGFWSYKTIVNILNDYEYNIILTVEGQRIELSDENYQERVLIIQRTLLLRDDEIKNAKTAVKYYRNIFKMSRRFVADITGIPFNTLRAFENTAERTILKTNALHVYKLAQLFGVTMEQLLLKECELNPDATMTLENKEV